MKIFGKIVFFVGFLLASAFNLLAVWADLESLSFESALTADGGLNLVCPIFVTPDAPMTISTTIWNTSARAVRRTIRATFTQGSVIYTRREEQIFDLAAGESRQFVWPLAAEDAAWGRVALARVYLFRAYPDSSGSASCGTLVIPLAGIPGGWLTAGWLILAGGLMLAGGRAWLGRGAAAEAERMVGVLGGLSSVGVFANLIGVFALAGAAVLFSLIALLVVGAQAGYSR